MNKLTPEQERTLNALAEQLVDAEVSEVKLLEIMQLDMKRRIYERIPYAEPKVVEALLLLQKNFLEESNQEIEQCPEVQVKQLEEALISQSMKFGKSFKKTVEQMYGTKIW